MMHEQLAITVLIVTTTLLSLVDAFYFSKVLQPRNPQRFIVVFVLFSIVLAMSLNGLIRTWSPSVASIYFLSAVNYGLRIGALLLLTRAKTGHVLFAFASLEAGFTFVQAVVDYYGLLTGIAMYGNDYFFEVQAYANLESVTLDAKTVLYFLSIYLCTLLFYGLLVYLLHYAWKTFVRPLSYERINLFVWVPISHIIVELSLNLYLGDANLQLVIYVLTSYTVVFGVPMDIYFLSDALSVMFAGATVTIFYILWKLKDTEELQHVRRLIRDQLQAQSRQYAELSHQEQAVSKLHHDVKNIEAAALRMTDEGNVDEAVRFLKQAMERWK